MSHRTSLEIFFPEAGSDADRISELEQKIRNLEYAIKMRDDHRAELEKQNAELLAALQQKPVAWACWPDGWGQTPKNMQLCDYEPLAYDQRRPLIFAALQPSTQEVSK